MNKEKSIYDVINDAKSDRQADLAKLCGKLEDEKQTRKKPKRRHKKQSTTETPTPTRKQRTPAERQPIKSNFIIFRSAK